MSNAAGTIERIALTFSEILEPLRTLLLPQNAGEFLKELGVGLTEPEVAQVSQQLTDAATKTDILVDKAFELFQAIKAEDMDAIIAKGKDTISQISQVFSGVKSLIQSLQGVKNDIPEPAKLPERIFNLMVVNYLETYPGVIPGLEFFGILERTLHDGVPASGIPPYVTYQLNFNKVADWLGNGGEQMRKMYGWGTETFDGQVLFGRVSAVMSSFNFPVSYTKSPAALDMVIAEATVDSAVHPRGVLVSGNLDMGMGPQVIGNDNWKLLTDVNVSLPSLYGLSFQPNGNISIKPANMSSPIQGGILTRLTGKKKDGTPFLLIGEAGGSRFEIGEVLVEGKSQLAWEQVMNKATGKFQVEAEIKGCRIVIETGGADGFLKNIIPVDSIETTFDLKAGISSEAGFYIQGSSALEVNIPYHVQLGPVAFEGLTIGVRPKNGKIPLTVGANIKATLGPITAYVQDMGLEAAFSFPNDRNGNLGPVQLDVRFKAPSGVGISVEAGLVKGGGFLLYSEDKGEYVGALELAIKDTLQINAIGIINTKMPDGSEGFSMLIIISTQFTPGIALGMGFFLNGLGGMLGINRTIHVPALLDGVKNDTISHIMFPDNIVKRMPVLLPQIKSLFPIQKDQFFIGLMARITWGVPALVTIDFGIALELSNPVRLAIMGMLKVELPKKEAPILRLQVNFAGVLDFDKKQLAFNASLFNSSILTFPLEGDMALRLNWGASKAFLLSVGGWHPAFKPPKELQMPKLKPLTLTILSGNPNLVLSAYFAVTSNTVQFGARVDFRYQVSKFKVVGFLGYDVLFQFSPFHFMANVMAGLAVKMGNSTICAIDLNFNLTGPTPWRAQGTASFSILFISVKVNFNITWGQAQKVINPKVAVLPMVMSALSQDANWTTELPANRTNLVSMGKAKTAPGEILLQSFGALKVSQIIMPMEMDIQKFGNNDPQDIKRVKITALKLGGQNMTLETVRDSFSPASFRKMSDKDKLQSASYSQEKSGVKVKDSGTLTVKYGINRPVKYDVSLSDQVVRSAGTTTLDQSLFRQMGLGGEVSKSSLSAANKQQRQLVGNAVEIGDETFVIIDNATAAKITSGIDFAGGTRAEAEQALTGYVKANPAKKGKVSVISAFELI
jgi:hypothetical protein